MCSVPSSSTGYRPTLSTPIIAGATVYQSFPESGNMGKVLPKYLASWTTRQLEVVGVNVKPETKVVNTQCKGNGYVYTRCSSPPRGRLHPVPHPVLQHCPCAAPVAHTRVGYNNPTFAME